MAMVHRFPALNRPGVPDVSVCIANYNGMEVLGDCIDSVLAQQGIEFEILVHDDASTDGSADWIRERYPHVELLAAEHNAGFCVANNRMVAHARGAYVLLLNNDAALLPDALGTLLAEARGCRMPGVLTLPQLDWETGALVDRGCLLDPFCNPVPSLDPARDDVAMVIGACLFLPRSLWEEIGGFPEWFGSIAEDMFLCAAARLRGCNVRCTRGSGYRHRQGASFGGNRVADGKLRTTYRRRALSERNKTAVMAICTPGLLAGPLLALHGLLLVVEGAMLSLLKRDWRLWREVYWGVFPHAWQQRGLWASLRARVQGSRTIGIRDYFRPFVLAPRKLVMLCRHGIPGIR